MAQITSHYLDTTYFGKLLTAIRILHILGNYRPLFEYYVSWEPAPDPTGNQHLILLGPTPEPTMRLE